MGWAVMLRAIVFQASNDMMISRQANGPSGRVSKAEQVVSHEAQEPATLPGASMLVNEQMRSLCISTLKTVLPLNVKEHVSGHLVTSFHCTYMCAISQWLQTTSS